MALLNVIQPNHLTGFGPGGMSGCAVGACATGDWFDNSSGSVMFYVNNNGTNNQCVTWNFNSNTTIDGQAPPNPNGCIVNGTFQTFGPFNGTWYNNLTTQYMNVTYSNATNLTVMPFLAGD